MEIKAEKITPYGSDDPKSRQVEAMFDNIAPAYDFMNRAMTFGVDRSWRRKVVRAIAADLPATILDVATGTGDMALQLASAIPTAHITGVDLSEGMLTVGRRKVAEASLEERILLTRGDCLQLPFADASFDSVTVAFGVRNFEHLDRGYAEMARVLRAGGKLYIIELSTPRSPLVSPFYRLYTRWLIPAVGRFVSKDTRAYTYLPDSIAAMPQGDKMLALMTDAGLITPRLHSLTFGVCSIYTAVKPPIPASPSSNPPRQ